MEKLIKLGFTEEEIKTLKVGYAIRKDNDFSKIEFRLYKLIYNLKNDDFEIVLQESHCGYGKCDFWTGWETVAYNIIL